MENPSLPPIPAAPPEPPEAPTWAIPASPQAPEQESVQEPKPEPELTEKTPKISKRLAQKNINFFAVLQTESKNTSNHKTHNKQVYLLTAFILVNLIFTGVVGGLNHHKHQQIKALQDFLGQPDVVSTLLMDQMLTTGLNASAQDLQTCNGLQAYLDTAQGFTTSIYQQIAQIKPDTVQIVALAFSNLAVSINCTTSNNIPPADYAKALEQLQGFATVSYLGFSTAQEQEGSGKIIFPIICQLKEASND